MTGKKGYRIDRLDLNRRMVRASAAVTRRKNTIHSLSEVDISVPRRLIRDHREAAGQKISFTAYLVTCLARVVGENPEFNSFIKGNRLVLLDDVTVSVLIERELDGKSVPEPVGIREAQRKTCAQIQDEIRKAKDIDGNKLGDLSDITWLKLIPSFMLKTFVRMASRNIAMARKFGKVAVTALGMIGREPGWFIPHGSATVLMTVGGITGKVIEKDDGFESREYLSITYSFDHDIIDGAPAARFIRQLNDQIRSGEILRQELGKKPEPGS